MISWLLDTAPDGAFDAAWDQVPPALRMMYRVWWRRRYERAFGSVGTASAPDALVIPYVTQRGPCAQWAAR